MKKIKENKAAHLIAYDKAVVAYKKEALKKLSELTKLANDGNMTLKLNLTTPVDNRKTTIKLSICLIGKLKLKLN